MFKTEPQYPPAEGDENDPTFWQSLVAFFTRLWNPTTVEAEQLGFAYVYDEGGTLLAETGTGGANSAGVTQHIWLATASGPTPVATMINGIAFAVHADHLNAPRRITAADGQVLWQWGYSAFGDEEPTVAAKRFTSATTNPTTGITGASAVTYNLRYPGQYADTESGLFYNYFRSYDNRIGRYTQPDPIGLDGGWNRFGYAGANPLRHVDRDGRFFFVPLLGPSAAAFAADVAVAGAAWWALQPSSTPKIGNSWPTYPSDDNSKGDKYDRDASACYEQCAHHLDPSCSKDHQASDYRKCFRRCMFDKGHPGLPPD